MVFCDPIFVLNHHTARVLWERRQIVKRNKIAPKQIFQEYCEKFKKFEHPNELEEPPSQEKWEKRVVLLRKQWLQTLDKSDVLDEHKIDIALHQIFTHVRFKKHVLEVRCADRPPTGFEMAPAAFWVGLLTVDTIRDKLMKIFSRWSVDERKIVNANACILNLSNIGPAGKNMMPAHPPVAS